MEPEFIAVAISIAALALRQEFVARQGSNIHTQIQAKLGGVAVKINRLVEMHDHADDFDFGTKTTNRVLLEMEGVNTQILAHQSSIDQTLKEMVGLMRWDIRRRGGDPPPAGEEG